MKGALAKRYAKALIGVGRDEGVYEEYGRELRTTLAVFTANPDLYKILLNPMYKIEERSSLVEKLKESMKLSDSLARFLQILVNTRNIRLLDEIAKAYSKLEDELAGRIRATIESPMELDAATLDEIKKKLEDIAGKQVVLSLKTEPSLIGGLVIRIENTIMDGSLRTQLELMKENIKGNVV